MQYQNRKLSTINNQPLLSQLVSITPNNMTKSTTVPVRIHLSVPGEEFEHSSPLSSIVTLTTNKLTTNIHKPLSTNFDNGQRAAVRFSSVSSSYAQFLKQRDMDKVKKIVSHSINKVSYICF
jgi:hypothetical protein